MYTILSPWLSTKIFWCILPVGSVRVYLYKDWHFQCAFTSLKFSKEKDSNIIDTHWQTMVNRKYFPHITIESRDLGILMLFVCTYSPCLMYCSVRSYSLDLHTLKSLELCILDVLYVFAVLFIMVLQNYPE